MRPRALKLLEDVHAAAEAIQTYTAGKSERDYLADRMLRDAVERRFEIIGEAVRRLRSEDAAVAARIDQSDRIVEFRNVLAHGYDAIDDRRVWQTLIADLPKLLSDVRHLLDELAAP